MQSCRTANSPSTSRFYPKGYELSFRPATFQPYILTPLTRHGIVKYRPCFGISWGVTMPLDVLLLEDDPSKKNRLLTLLNARKELFNRVDTALSTNDALRHMAARLYDL